MQTKNVYRTPIDLGKTTSNEQNSLAHVDDLINSIDYDAPERTPIYAALNGQVISVKDNSNVGGTDKKFEGDGNYIEILHKNNEISEYEHLRQHSAKVKVGDRVSTGDIIAEVGNTGWSECPHLHFMVYPKDSPYKTLRIQFEKRQEKSTTKSMDLFGEALLGYANGDRRPFYLLDQTGEKKVYSLVDRFRSYSKLNKHEKKLISLSRGNILDIGCGTGNVIPYLQKQGEVIGIDISPAVIEVAKQRGCDTCIVADIFSYSPKQKFNTITLFGNDIGIGGTIKRTKVFLQVLKKLLEDDGQILAVVRNYTRGEYGEMTLTPIWKKKIGPKFGWIIFNIEFLNKLCTEQNLQLKIVSASWKYKLVKISKK